MMKSFNQHISESMPCIHNGNCSCKIPKIVQDQCRTRLEGLLVVVTEADSSKVGKKFGAKAAKRVEGLKSDKLPEGPGWVVKSQSGPTGKEVSVNEADSKYIVEKNPNDGMWYVMGHVGRNKWMPVSNGFKDKGKAQKWAKSQSKVDVAAKGEVGGV